MLTYILEVIFFLSAGIVLYLFVVRLPAIEGMGEEGRPRKNVSVLQEKVMQLADKKFALSAMKLLRRLRLIILKIDNVVARSLEKMKEKSDEQNSEQKTHILKGVEESVEEDKNNKSE